MTTHDRPFYDAYAVPGPTHEPARWHVLAYHRETKFTRLVCSYLGPKAEHRARQYAERMNALA